MKNTTLQKIRQATTWGALLLTMGMSLPTHAQDPFIGEIRMFAGDFAPRGWALAQGQLMSIAQNTALFSILGTTYGGNGQTTFALPDLRGKIAVGTGGTFNPSIGGQGGQTSVTLTSSQLPAHSHTLNVSNGAATTSETGSDKVLATAQNAGIYTTGTANATLSTTSIGSTGSNASIPTMPPYLVINYIIALEGIFPSRN